MILYLGKFAIYVNLAKNIYISRTVTLTQLILCLKEPETISLYTTFVETMGLESIFFKLLQKL